VWLEMKDRLRDIDLNPVRFHSVKNPEVLMNVFNFYVHLNPQAGKYIYHLYKKNVSDFYSSKEHHLRSMETMIKCRQEGKILP